jgi:hypothetical protein
MSLLAGSVIACVLTASMWAMKIGFWFPPFWPGLFFSWVVIIVTRGEQWADRIGLVLITFGNAVFYSWISLKVIGADITARGWLGRHLLR